MLQKKIIIHLVETYIPDQLMDELLSVVQQYAAEEMNKRLCVK